MTNTDTTTTTTTTMMMTGQEKIAIASTKIVYVLAVSGCGKSFTGDYLGVMHGFHHVDGGKFCFIDNNSSSHFSFSLYSYSSRHHYYITSLLSNIKSYVKFLSFFRNII